MNAFIEWRANDECERGSSFLAHLHNSWGSAAARRYTQQQQKNNQLDPFFVCEYVFFCIPVLVYLTR